jgi:hypothetical protein
VYAYRSTVAAGMKWLYKGLTISDVTLGQIAKIYATMAKIRGRNNMLVIVAYQAFVQ